MADSPPSFSFVHAADLHLDTPFHGVQVAAPHVAEALRDASLSAFDAIVDLALEHQVAFVCFAGDIYDGAERGIRAQLRFFDGLSRLSDAGIMSFVVHGNHDPLESGWSAVATTWPEAVTIFGPPADSANAEVIAVERDGQRVATVQGVSYATRETHENLSQLLVRPEGPGVHIGLLHCNVEGSPAKYANYSPCTVNDLRATQLDYLALGHVHDRRVLAGADSSRDPWIVYPGNTQARSINEVGPKGVYLVHVASGIVEEPIFVACDSIRFCHREVAIDHCESVAELMAQLRALGRELLAECDGRSVVVRATLTGRSPIHRQLTRPGDLMALLDELREESAVTVPFCWWEQLVDQTALPRDLDEMRQRSDFSSDLLSLSDTFVAEESPSDELFDDLVGSLAKTFRNELEELFGQPTVRQKLLQAAQLRALDELAGDQ